MAIDLKTPIPGPQSVALMQRRNAAVPRGPFHANPIFARSAKGSTVTDVDGNTFLDFAAGIGVVNVGHTPPSVVQAVQAQAAELIHSSFNVLPYEGYVALAERINARVPGDFPKKTFICNTGAEAVENAVKFARAYTGRQGIVCFDHAFHGRTYMAMTLTSKVNPYKAGFAPYNPEVYRAPFPYEYRCPSGESCDNTGCGRCFTSLEQQITNQIGVDQVAAVIVEPVLGEGGFMPVPKVWLQKLRAFCSDHNIVLIIDEVQAGFGRTGKFFALDHYGIEADVMCLAKGIGAGMPIAAVCGRAEIMDAPGVGGVGGTYNGNPLACAAALEVFDLLERDEGALLKHAEHIGERIGEYFQRFYATYEKVGNVRGIGPMLAMEFVTDRESKKPDKAFTQALTKYCYENGVIIITAGTFGNIFRLLVPLTISDEELDEGMAVIEAGLKGLS